MPVTRSRTSSEQSAPEVVSDDLKQVETEEKDLPLTSQKHEVNVETKILNQPEEVNNSTNNATKQMTAPAETNEPSAAEENNASKSNEETNEKEENGVSNENHERLDAKRKSEVGLVETPDSTELTAKKAKVEDETTKVAETEEATPAAPVEASA